MPELMFFVERITFPHEAGYAFCIKRKENGQDNEEAHKQ
jgi:hypothetical protein